MRLHVIRRFALTGLLLTLAPATAARELPTFRLLEGRPLPLRLDHERVAVAYAADSSSQARAAALDAAGLEHAVATPTGLAGWQLLRPDSPSIDVSDTDARLAALLRSSIVEFASPVFLGANDSRAVVTPLLHLRVRPPYRETAASWLPTIAPGTRAIARDFGRMPGVWRLRSDARNGFDLLALANALAGDPRIAWAEPEMLHIARKETLPDDPGFAYLWGLSNSAQFGGTPGIDTDASAAWDITTGFGAPVLILDDGVQQNHPDLTWTAGKDCTSQAPGNGGGPFNACDDHGTLVAGAIAAVMDNALGTVGMAPDATVLSARVSVSSVPCDGFGTYLDGWIICGLDWGEQVGARVSNSSWSLGWFPQAVGDKYAATRAGGMVHFASAGNAGGTSFSFPASHSAVNAVAAIDPTGARASYSNHGPGLSVSAPGTYIYTTDRTGAAGSAGDYAFRSGTSLASPQAAGVAALIVSLEPALSAQAIEQKLQCSARDLGDPGFDGDYGHGFVNAERAVIAPVGVDSDTDGSEDACDNCPTGANFDQADADHDGIGDVCDLCPNDALDDLDADGHCADADNCPSFANPTQQDVDGDGVGDACACAAPKRVYTGGAADDLFGRRARGVGDVNADGFDDLIVGASQNDTAGNEAGAAWVYSGADGSPLYVLTAESARDRFGRSVAGLGDIDVDGFGDFVVSAYLNDGGGIDAGRVYVFRGGPGPYPKFLTAAAAHYHLSGEVAGDGFGTSLATVRDLDGDGVRDLLVGALDDSTGVDDPGTVYLYSGANGDGIHTWTGEADGDGFGRTLADAGDFDGDGVTDLLIGASGHDGAGSASGRAYVYSGLDGSLLSTITGEQAGDTLGASVAAAGNLNGDGRDDLIVGAPHSSGGSTDAGRAYVVFGRPGPYPVAISAADADKILTGEFVYDELGRSVAGIGDVDGDGTDDLAVGAGLRGTPTRGLTGQVFVYSGETGVVLQRLPGETAWDGFGSWIDGGSDLNRDGMRDLIVGVPASDAGGVDAGRAYVFQLGDADADGFAGGCDNCPRGFNPDQAPATFGETIVASSRGTFGWTTAQDVDWVRGDLHAVGAYFVDDAGSLLDAVSLLDETDPPATHGFFYLVRLGGSCNASSWQSAPNAEPSRDAVLP